MKPVTYWEVPREWPGEDVWIIGGGPSLEGFDASVLKGRRVIAVNNAYLLAPWADVLFFGDAKWYRWNQHDLKRHVGKYKVTRAIVPNDLYDLKYLRFKSECKFSLERDTVGGRDSGHAAINLAALFGAARIFLLGFDMKKREGRNNWHELHKRDVDESRYAKTFIPGFDHTAKMAKKLKIEIYNCNPDSALDCFPKVTIDEALEL